MILTDKPQFVRVLQATMSLYDRELANDALHLWWGALEHLPIEAVTKALQAHIQGEGGHFAPLPADVIKASKQESGHIPPDEAWALALTALDDQDSIIWTTQVAEAWGAAWPCMENGDKYGARLTFLSAYDRCIKEGSPVWKVSLGYSHEGRERAVDEALRRGIVNAEKARSLLPYSCQRVPSSAGLLPAPERTPEQVANSLAMLAQIKAALGVMPDEA